MRFPLHVATDMAKWQFQNKVAGNKRYPIVLMLEPLYTCNLACIGCTPERHTGKLKDRLSVEDCLQSVDDCGAPVVSICGGEPTLYPEIVELIEGCIARKKQVILCTNGIELESFYAKMKPHKRLLINVHLDGMRETHDMVCRREGVFDTAIEQIKEGLRRGYAVSTNTTVYRETSLEELEEMAALLTPMGVQGMLVSPGYHYQAIEGADEHFMFRDEIERKFKRVIQLAKSYAISSTPLFLEFAAGLRDYPCTPWGNPTRTPMGWRGPCYLIGEKFYPTWDEFWTGVNWDYWESRQDDRCQNCKMHSGFEPSVVRHLGSSAADLWKMARYQFGPRPGGRPVGVDG
ncbi:MAG: adenosyl-hopene transferase HpnH [Deltaproteobacteria bacterium]